jgi:uncharacterized protein YndB with AHSA1/START domain
MTATVAPKKLAVSKPSDREIRTERVFDAPRERVWRALTEPKLIAQWWGRGNKLVIEKHELKAGGRWRYVEHSDGGEHGFEGRFREVTPPERAVQTFSWDGMPAHVMVSTMELIDLGNGRTKVVTTSLFHTTEERDGMVNSGMEGGLSQSYDALEKLLATLS